jgi:hypothetical protein
LWCGIDNEFEFALLAVVNRQTFHQQSTETRSSATTERVEDKEALETSTVISNSSNLVQDLIDQFFADSVVPSSVVVGSILFSGDHLLWVEETSVCASADFINDIGLEIGVDGARDIFAIAFERVSVRIKHLGSDYGPVSEKKVLKP